jgi:hypothetical protein
MLWRHPRLIVGLGWIGIVGGLAAVGAGYWRFINLVPDYPRALVALPLPNAYDDSVRAGQLCVAAGGARVPPASSDSAPRRASDPDVPLAQVRAVVARNRAALALWRRGRGNVYRNPPVTSFQQMFPGAEFRALGQVLVAEGKLAEREGRMPSAVRSYLDCLRLGVDVPQAGRARPRLLAGTPAGPVCRQAAHLSTAEKPCPRLQPRPGRG